MKKRTKIVATVSVKISDVDFLRKLHEAGMDVVRLNTAHQSLDDAKKVVDNVRKVSDKIPILLDTKGPEIRTTKTATEIEVHKGERIFFKGDPDCLSTTDCVCVSYKNFVEDIPINAKILIDDGAVEFLVIEKQDDKLLCEVQNDGVVQSKKSINVPGVSVKLPSLSPKDIDFIHFAIENDIEFIAHSFVRNKEDVIDIKKILHSKNSKIKIIAKIENQEGVDNIDEILDHVYGIMVARGDLGIEIAAEKIPAIQKMIERKCIAQRKPVIVATQMLHSMINNPRPTRAEVSDVANAVFDGTDALMLSGETASGAYPLEAVETMARIAIEVEHSRRDFIKMHAVGVHNELTSFLCKSAVESTVMLSTKVIVADTVTGETIRELAAYRGKNIIYSMCYNPRIMRELALSYGVYCDYMNPRNTTDEFLHTALTTLLGKNLYQADDLVVVVAGNFGGGYGPSFIEISSIEKLIERQEKYLTLRNKSNEISNQ